MIIGLLSSIANTVTSDRIQFGLQIHTDAATKEIDYARVIGGIMREILLTFTHNNDHLGFGRDTDIYELGEIIVNKLRTSGTSTTKTKRLLYAAWVQWFRRFQKGEFDEETNAKQSTISNEEKTTTKTKRTPKDTRPSRRS